jgi:hypothetical protein
MALQCLFIFRLNREQVSHLLKRDYPVYENSPAPNFLIELRLPILHFTPFIVSPTLHYYSDFFADY